MRVTLKRRRDRSAAARPMRAARAGSSRRCASLAATAEWSPISTRKPPTASSTTSEAPPARVATTGQPASCASRRVFGKPSMSEVSTVARATRMKSATSRRTPRKRTCPDRPRRAASSCIARPSSPSPTSRATNRRSLAARTAHARRNTSGRFGPTSRPAQSRIGTPRGRSSRRRSSPSLSVVDRAGSRPFRTTRTIWAGISGCQRRRLVRPLSELAITASIRGGLRR